MLTLLACLMTPTLLSAPPSMTLRVLPGLPVAGSEPLEWRALVTAGNRGENARTAEPEVVSEGVRILSLQPERATVEPGGRAVFFLHLQAKPGTARPEVTVRLRGAARAVERVELPLGVDLSQLEWQVWWQGGDSRLEEVRDVPGADVEWKPFRLPRLWQDLGVTWVHTQVFIPEAWRRECLTLQIRAVDDRDAAFLNGIEIGRTDGWDRQRVYKLPQPIINWGAENEIAVAVHNTYAGGGIYRTPILIAVGDAPPVDSLFGETVLQEETQRAAPGRVDRPAPFRRMVVRDGVLHYQNGGEVALWGVNIYPQSWTQYDSLAKLGVDHRRSIDEDIEDLSAAGIEILRIHVFDTEISDLGGNLVRNDHLDVLDYLVSKCNENGIYLMLTPMAWWWSPHARPDSFSRNTPKEAMALWAERWPAQANYLHQFLDHRNPYTGRRLVEEPCLALFEIINEPIYWSYGDVATGSTGQTGLSDEINRTAMAGVQAAFARFVPSPEWQTPSTFSYFRYDSIRRYIDAMIAAMRQAGADQPIASSTFGIADLDIAQAIADSRCDAITMGAYPGGLSEITDDRNLLGELGNRPYDSRFARKARLVYEFDAPGTINRVSRYPALARHWRNLGVQVACQFQYDARAVAHVNWDWSIHYLNLWHTPEKMASFLIAGEVFRRLPRGAPFPTPPEEQVFAPGAVSFPRNAALLCAEDAYMQARPTDWHPLPLPEAPRRILTVGSCPYLDYPGTGLVDLRIEGNTARLRIYPDVERLRYALQGTVEEPLTRLEYRPHPFRLRLQGWQEAKVERLQDGQWQPVAGRAGEFTAEPGNYRLRKD